MRIETQLCRLFPGAPATGLARRKPPIPDHADFLAKPFCIEELLALGVRLTGYP
ncbi:MAG TPA: hypothetical protein VFY70_05190 [Thermomicrobiales bacterium]|nr:hypothetical protein [Thermomicrobiales bacterium]